MKGARVLAQYYMDTREEYEMSMAYVRGDISKRVYYLYRHGKRWRTRKKQVSRARRIKGRGKEREKEMRRYEHMARRHERRIPAARRSH